MTRTFAWLGWSFFFLMAFTSTVEAQVPKVGNDYYEDSSDLGFKLKVPKGWDFVPPQPGEQTEIGRYAPENNSGVYIGGSTHALQGWLLKFDRSEADDEEEEEGIRRFRGGAEDLEGWLDNLSGNWVEVERKEYNVSKIPCIERHYMTEVGSGGNEGEKGMFTAQFALSDELDVVMCYVGNGDKKKWKKYVTAYRKMAKSLKRVEIEAVEVDTGGSLRSRKRARLQMEVAKNPGWELYETANYFVISNNDDSEFLDELMERLESIRLVYEETYPPEDAIAMYERAVAAAAEEKKNDDNPFRTRAVAEADPIEMSRLSVVRVCKDSDQYMAYGGPGGSAGYWSSSDEELVIYDDQKGGGRRNTWAVLNHEAFHQYIFYFYGSIAPHSWYNEGTGDFYSGYQIKNGRFRLKKFDWRTGTITGMIRAKTDDNDSYAPLEDMVRMTQGEYYGGNKFGLGGGQMYAQGWSFIYFMRTGKDNCRDWNDSWDGILDTYLETLLFERDLEKAVDVAFADVDWEELTSVWAEYTLRGK